MSARTTQSDVDMQQPRGGEAWRRLMIAVERFATWFLSHLPWFWRFVASVPSLRQFFNRLFINFIASRTKPRPHPYSTWGPGPASADPPADYVSWTGLVDRTYSGRHLGPSRAAGLPSVESVLPLFARKGEQVPCPKSSALFCFFAQWFTDSFLRVDPENVRKNTSNHEIDLCQIYGLNAADTRILRGGDKKKGGRLLSQVIDGQEFPPYLFKDDGSSVREEFLGLSYIKDGQYKYPILGKPGEDFNIPERKRRLFAGGLERANSTIFYSALNTIFLREHNQLCRQLALRHPEWKDDDDRLFETARNINIAKLLKIIIEDYINHISPALFKVYVDLDFAEKQPWYRTNRICSEFNLLYRWHPLVPTELKIGGATIPDKQFRFNNDYLLSLGIENAIEAASTLRAGRIMLGNTASFLMKAEEGALKKSRDWSLRGYNDYRQRFGLSRVATFEELTGEKILAAELEKVYTNVDRVDLLVGLFAEKRPENAVLGNLMSYMVGSDAFSQALTNPLLSQEVYPIAFGEFERDLVKDTSTLAQIVRRNTKIGDRKVTFTATRPIPGRYGPPLIGTILHSLDFFLVSGWLDYFRKRKARFASNVFRTNILGKRAIAVTDHDAIAPLFASADFKQDYGFGWAIPERGLVGNVTPSIFESGPAHDVPKTLYMNLLRARAATLSSTFDAVANEFIDRWAAAGRLRFTDELQDFAAAFLFEWVLGKRFDTGEVRYLYQGLFNHALTAPVEKYIPGSPYRRRLAIYGRLLPFVKAAPKFAEILTMAHDLGLKDDDAVAKQILFVLGMNSFLGTQNLMRSVVGELSLRPELCETLRLEIRAALGPITGPVDLRKLSAQSMPLLDRTLREVLRLHAPVALIFGRALRDHSIESASGIYSLPKDELMMGVIPMAHLDEAVFADPERFDPDRFLRPEASRHLIWPRGPQDGPVTPQERTCPGKDIAILTAKLFAVTLLMKCEWRLAEPPRWSRGWFLLNVAAPEGHLAVERFTRV